MDGNVSSQSPFNGLTQTYDDLSSACRVCVCIYSHTDVDFRDLPRYTRGAVCVVDSVRVYLHCLDQL